MEIAPIPFGAVGPPWWSDRTVYLVGGGVPLAIAGKLLGAVGVAGLPEFVDEKAARAGIAAWDAFRAAAK